MGRSWIVVMCAESVRFELYDERGATAADVAFTLARIDRLVERASGAFPNADVLRRTAVSIRNAIRNESVGDQELRWSASGSPFALHSTLARAARSGRLRARLHLENPHRREVDSVPPDLPQARPHNDDAWIGIVLKDESGRPASGARVEVRWPSGTRREGRLDDKGMLLLQPVEPGPCEVSFLDYDRTAIAWAAS